MPIHVRTVLSMAVFTLQLQIWIGAPSTTKVFKTLNDYYLVLYRKKFPILGLADKVEEVSVWTTEKKTVKREMENRKDFLKK